MKITKLLILSIAAVGLAACGNDNKGGDQTAKYKVSKEEWAAAFGLDKPFYFADNYKFGSTTVEGGEMSTSEFIVDGNKMKLKMDGNESYMAVNNGQYMGYSFNGSGWETEPLPNKPSFNDLFETLTPFTRDNAYDSYTFDDKTLSYVCASYKFDEDITIVGASIKFEDKKAVKFSFAIQSNQGNGNFVGDVTYGGQSVTLPTPDENKVTAEQWAAALGDKILNGYYTFNKSKSGYSEIRSLEEDGDKVKDDTEEKYYCKEEEQFYEYTNEGQWDRQIKPIAALYIPGSVIKQVSTMGLYTYDTTEKLYKANNAVVSGINISGLRMKFVNKELVSFSFSTVESEVTYYYSYEVVSLGGVTVDLPVID